MSVTKFDGQKKNWSEFLREINNEFPKSKVLRVANGSERYPLEIDLNEVPQAQRYAARKDVQKLQKAWNDNNVLAKALIGENLAK
jgi:hypothetical protein